MPAITLSLPVLGLMDGDSKPYFRNTCYDFPQDTQLLSGLILSLLAY